MSIFTICSFGQDLRNMTLLTTISTREKKLHHKLKFKFGKHHHTFPFKTIMSFYWIAFSQLLGGGCVLQVQMSFFVLNPLLRCSVPFLFVHILYFAHLFSFLSLPLGFHLWTLWQSSLRMEKSIFYPNWFSKRNAKVLSKRTSIPIQHTQLLGSSLCKVNCMYF